MSEASWDAPAVSILFRPERSIDNALVSLWDMDEARDASDR
ncbi:hypothetical protein MSSD14B_17210 [Marinobacter salsuginis]|uniref:Uncharacterized protein n=1 Tax=Marinobacter salsuginis TaxID=418719 RepID=A0A5M3PYR7_9GAMM|nr:hypothetical protein MSSD14B_17210 [Marinobacter salsuginis]